ncbi:purine and uridine phosphorylase [Aspergillus terreus]|uniref:Purine and uridine phosphorylase n=1 Tax=Aspergillus terreus TaxID=33178 RepID=A0A5M3Z979_ASPTE|nr:hypothetical protein ATETN484_0010007300 [Aspergillus terreus]GFF18123.1 purine and uridine phosphorylase [Aspergillus terreus]
MESPQQSPFSNEQYTVGWISTLPIEMAAAKGMFDEEHGSPQTPSAEADLNAYLLGRIGHFNVVVACLPRDQVGSVSAAVAARDMLSTFPRVRFGLLVGIGAGLPDDDNDIRLGDVVISSDKASGGVVVYDFGKRLADGSFESISTLNRPPRLLSSALVQMEAAHFTRKNHVSHYIDGMLVKYPYMRQRYRRPAQETDRLFRSDYLHVSGSTCKDCDASAEVQRESRLHDDPMIHYGTIATGDSVIKHSPTREELRQKHNAIGLDMEASGLMNNYPCIVIRGISDYADSHKNDHWHAYAAAAAAACAKELLQYVERKKVDIASAAKDVLNEVCEHVSVVRNTLVTEQIRKTLDWITTLDFAVEQRSIIKTPGTGSWFIRSPKFEEWLHGQRCTLFCHGIPGAGKTVMCSIIIDFLEARFQYDANIKVTFLFCSHQPRHDQTVAHLLLCLLRQLACKGGVLSSHIQDLYRMHCHHASASLKDEVISNALAATARSYDKVFIIIDGMDEYHPLKPEEREMLLYELFKLQERSAVNILVTSRFIPEIAHIFKDLPSLEIRACGGDVLSYASSRIPALARGAISQYPEVEDEIKKHLVERVDGMFLLARLHLDHLMGFTTIGQVKEALTSLRSGEEGLSEAYDQAMNRIQSQPHPCRQMAIEILAWLTFSKRALHQSELQHALATRANSCELQAKLIPTTESIVSLCAGLVVCQKPDGIVCLAHYTMKEYLQRSPFVHDAEVTITRKCVAYLSLKVFSEWTCSSTAEYIRRIDEYPFYDYSVKYWGAHAAMALRKASEIQEAIFNFLENECLITTAIQARVIRPSRSDKEFEERAESLRAEFWDRSAASHLRVKGIHLAAFYGLNKIILHYLDTGEDMEVGDSYGYTPLIYAVKVDVFMVELFLANGAEINVTDRDRMSALCYAAAAGNLHLTQILLDEGAEINVHYTSYEDEGSTLLLAQRSGNKEVVRLLLHKASDINFANPCGMTALWAGAYSAVAYSGNEQLVRLLIESGMSASRVWYRRTRTK